jgi:dGTPase
MTDEHTHSLSAIAVSPAESIGRQHADPYERGNPFDVDRHRICASAAFRRLQYKTQVFVNDEHDHFRTRLTHTLEVANIARRLARALDVNEPLAEVIALAHDLGHPPFGHAGESTLRELMSERGGFEHNVHALRTVDYLEHPYPQFRGLNLSFEVREGLIKHNTEYDRPDLASADGLDVDDLLAEGKYPTIEAQIANVADRIAYDGHDLEDAIGAQMIDESALADVTLWTDAAISVRRSHPQLGLFAVRRPVLDRMIERLIDDVVTETIKRTQSADVKTVEDVRHAREPMVAFSTETLPLARELEGCLVQRVYRHHRLVRMDTKARSFIERIFDAYVRDPAMLPPRFSSRVDAQGEHRVVCDYIAGMTDRFCQDEYNRLFQPHERV